VSGDKLRICLGGGTKDPRPAEFGCEDDSRYSVFELRREKLSPPAGDKALVGSWQSDAFEGVGNGQRIHVPPGRIEILDGYLFFTSTEKGKSEGWIGGKYTVDATKNPKWVDVELIGPLFAEKAGKLYGSYEIADGRLKMALGVKRLTRPLEFTQATDAILLDVKATKESLGIVGGPLPTALDMAMPLPQPGNHLPHPLPGTPGTLPVQDPLPQPGNHLPHPLPGTPKAPFMPDALPPAGAPSDYPRAGPVTTKPEAAPAPRKP
jgi:uncharacterized protein (TIGR03067 family)